MAEARGDNGEGAEVCVARGGWVQKGDSSGDACGCLRVVAAGLRLFSRYFRFFPNSQGGISDNFVFREGFGEAGEFGKEFGAFADDGEGGTAKREGPAGASEDVLVGEGGVPVDETEGDAVQAGLESGGRKLGFELERQVVGLARVFAVEAMGGDSLAVDDEVDLCDQGKQGGFADEGEEGLGAGFKVDLGGEAEEEVAIGGSAAEIVAALRQEGDFKRDGIAGLSTKTRHNGG